MALEHADCVALLEAVSSPVYRGVLGVMYGCGLRIGEAVRLRVEDVNGERGFVRVVGKGNKERLAPLSRELYEDLRRVWKLRRHPEWVFGNQPGTNHVDANLVGSVFRKARAESGIKQEATSHSLRHSFAARLTEDGVPIEMVSILLGHSSVTTTRTYLHLTEVTRKRIRKAAAGFTIPLFD